MRLILIGSGSFIARHVCSSAARESEEIIPVPHDADLSKLLKSSDIVINFAIHPDFRDTEYNEDYDFDLRAAHAAVQCGARFIMLSTRKVYSSNVRWGATENATARGDNTIYGNNKAASEQAVRDLGCNQLSILRLSNIIGFEYASKEPRNSFMGRVLRRLKADGIVEFDMSSDTEKDFLPVEICAKAILQIAHSTETGIFNLGAGFPTSCGDIAKAVCDGYGAGELVVLTDKIDDEFYLDTGKWQSTFGPLCTRSELIEYSKSLGRRLKNA